MNYKKMVKKVITSLFVYFVYVFNLNAQENKLFKEYISSFTEIYLTDDLHLFSTKEYSMNFFDIEKTHKKFVENVVENINKADLIRTWLMYKLNDLYLAILIYGIEEDKVSKNNKDIYYFI
jgi:hypothetical protein